MPLFNNEKDGRWSPRPNTILVDSEQLESGEGMSADFKKIAAREIEEFKAEYRARFPGPRRRQLTEEDLLREVMNTVGKPGKLGEHVKCVVSVSMLTEGWDANTVTHVLGVRAFGTQLLCEQVVGRALRRMSYAANAEGRFEPEYAEIYGVPFSFIPCSGSIANPKPGPMPTRVRALESRLACEITFPRLLGYRYELPTRKLTPEFTDDSRLTLTTADIPIKTENAPIVGESSIHSLDDLKKRRPSEVAFLLAKLTLGEILPPGRRDPAKRRPPSTDSTARCRPGCSRRCSRLPSDGSRGYVHCKDHTFPQLLLLVEFAHDAADRIYGAIVRGSKGSPDGPPSLRPILRPYDTIGSTRYVDFDTTRPGFRHSRRQVPRLPRRRRHRQLGAKDGPNPGRDMDEVIRYVEEPQPRLHDPLYNQR